MSGNNLHEKITHYMSKHALFFFIILATAIIATGYEFLIYKEVRMSRNTAARQVIEINKSLTNTVVHFQSRVNNLGTSLTRTTQDMNLLADELYTEKNKNSVFEKQIEEIASTVGVLDKLSKTDKELLEKYSRVFFLSEHYVPESLVVINNSYWHDPDKPLQIHTKAEPFLMNMLDTAREQGLDLQVVSAYRSFGIQAQLKSEYNFIFGEGTANQFSADQGYSEHQLATTVDLATTETANTFAGFENTEEYIWLVGNAHRFGFTLSYPENNSYYTYEPWHWRFVGIELATRLHNNNQHFYDLEQRELDKYLVSIFD